ncbi:MAG: M3 family oligoendopeptidase [Chloroflexi bacterium RBG_16_57_11]|nr:MAG: M3 family oligoendopeptidase [Chloroflexi bacterium RBG_16_57_11]
MLAPLPQQPVEFMRWSWAEIEPYYAELIERPFSATSISGWLADWTRLAELVYERFQRLYVAITVDTTDVASKQEYDSFLDRIYPNAQTAEQKLKETLLASGLEPAGFDVPLRNLRLEAEIFRQENLPLLTEELKLNAEYDQIIGAQTVNWEGKELTLPQLRPVAQDHDRAVRERAWRLAAERQLADRRAIDDLWGKLLPLRDQLAHNAGLSSYRDYRWKQMLRFDYNPQDCTRFHRAIELAAVPAAFRLYEGRRQKLGVETLRPWDLEVDALGRPPLKPYTQIDQLEDGVSAIFHQVDPQLGEYFDTMRQEGLLDLENRKGKAPGGYCTEFVASKRPFIFMNAVGLHDDVQTLLHEGGHAFHVFETNALPYIQQKQVSLEFAEVASMGMELLASPYLSMAGGFYTPPDATRAFTTNLEEIIRFWPYMAVVDAFQHWVYEHPQAAIQPASRDARWSELWDRFMTGVDWSGLEDEKATGWQRKPHITQVPFYYIEYGLAQLGALQVWRNALKDKAGAVRAYRRALALGGTVGLSDLYFAAGARLVFDVEPLQEIIDLMENAIATQPLL